MKRKVLPVVSSVLFSLTVFVSCDSYLADGVRVAWAKQLFQQGNYQEALLYLLEAEQNRIQNASRSAKPKFLALRRIQYNIGLIYSALGQNRAAVELWQAILDQGGRRDDESLQFALLYNIGLLYAQIGQNENARRNLVQALDLRPDHEGARKALELSLESLKQGPLNAEKLSKEEQLKESLPAQSGISDEQILDYISRQAHYRFQRDAKAAQVLRNDW
ncbi:MAG: hypothetical protein AAF975_04230 [Spirochaetota bacterium]